MILKIIDLVAGIATLALSHMLHSSETSDTYCCLEVSNISSVVNYFLCGEYSSFYIHFLGVLMNIFSDLTGFLHLIMWSILFPMTACIYTSHYSSF